MKHKIIQNIINQISTCHIYSSRGINFYSKGGDILERFYDSVGTLYGYVDNNVIYDCCGRVMGYTDGCNIYDSCRRPLAYINRGYVYSSNGTPLGYYNSRNYRLYDMNGNYLGYGNSGYSGLLGAILLLLLLRPFSRFYF